VLVLNQDIIEISAEPVLRLWHSDEDRELQHCTLTVLQCVGDDEMTFELELWMDLCIVSEWIGRRQAGSKQKQPLCIGSVPGSGIPPLQQERVWAPQIRPRLGKSEHLYWPKNLVTYTVALRSSGSFGELPSHAVATPFCLISSFDSRVGAIV
jgi:hypothetical protein